MNHNLGQTRSSLKSDHLLQTPDTFIHTPLPGANGIDFVVHAAPQLGADFLFATATFQAGAVLPKPPTGVSRFIYVVEGSLNVIASTEQPFNEQLSKDHFMYIPSLAVVETIQAVTGSRVILIEKHFIFSGQQEPDQTVRFGNEAQTKSEPLGGDQDLQVRRLMPDGEAWDFAVNTMTYAPGAALAMVEIHVMEHGLLMLEGGGIYRLGESWYPVAAGDFIWMAAYCPQWFGALGKTPAKYLIYKDWYRHPLAKR